MGTPTRLAVSHPCFTSINPDHTTSSGNYGNNYFSGGSTPKALSTKILAHGSCQAISSVAAGIHTMTHVVTSFMSVEMASIFSTIDHPSSARNSVLGFPLNGSQQNSLCPSIRSNLALTMSGSSTRTYPLSSPQIPYRSVPHSKNISTILIRGNSNCLNRSKCTTHVMNLSASSPYLFEPPLHLRYSSSASAMGQHSTSPCPSGGL